MKTASLLTLLCTATLLITGCTDTSSRQERPNILIILTDDQGTLDLRSFGSADLYTPHIDALASRGVKFTQAYAHAVCCPARASLLTGRYPQRANINTWTQGNPREGVTDRNMYLSEVTLAEVVKPLGYHTGLFGKWHVGGSMEHGPLAQGFDEFFGIRNGFIDNYNHYFLHEPGYHDLWHNQKEVFEPGNYFPSLITNKAMEFVETHRDEPFLVYLGYNIPHYPEEAAREYEEHYGQMPEPRKSYAQTISSLDEEVGRLMGHLQQLGLLDNTLVVFASDNGHSTESYQIKSVDHPSGKPQGEAYGAKGGGGNTGKWIGSKGSFLEGGVRVPMIVSLPGRFPENESRDQIVTLMDVMPTVCELLEVPLPEKEIDGKSLLTVIDDNADALRYETLHFQWQDQWAVRQGDWKLIVNGKKELKGGPEYLLDSIYLANLADPNPEQMNYAQDHPELVSALTSLHNTWSKSLEQSEQR
ncbi:sulfatase-like hydrolase/transferase [Marinoscillum furvescens]|uniref:Arylsulfatase A-like enzyme n=1 Tax=Marinoscillum furvescens DSM 4134 TaxID=1122208 RepID=A0A3D9L7R3_MARFU|nr:sulfatase-like hydrolase/transferase [Marinoscillum furvescens]REE01525.1 arylsulfatase A-like enzyme [Marinoscillum furvescens DSM 4134]